MRWRGFMQEYIDKHENFLPASVLDLCFYSAGFEVCKPGHSAGPRLRAYNLIHFILSGKGEFHINGHKFYLQKGDAFIIPNDKVCFYKADDLNPWTYVWINFTGINSQMYAYELMNTTEDIFIIHNVNTEKYRNQIFEILNAKQNEISRYFKCNSILLNIMSMLFEEVQVHDKKANKKNMASEIKRYLDINYPEKIQMKQVANYFGIHPNYLTHIFHDEFSVSPKKYLTSLKLNKACILIKTTDLPISIIADSLGFEDQLSFSKIFKKEYEMSPLNYRKQHKK